MTCLALRIGLIVLGAPAMIVLWLMGRKYGEAWGPWVVSWRHSWRMAKLRLEQ